jgi:heat shock protein HspQ
MDGRQSGHILFQNTGAFVDTDPVFCNGSDSQ